MSPITQVYTYHAGTVPVVVNMPHTAMHVPPAILERLTPAARELPDTDWHIDRLYDFARGMGAHILIPTHSRYVVDLNRGPDNESLYPGRFTTGVCPLTTFDGAPLYMEYEEPDAGEIEARIAEYWQPYHDKLQSVLDAIHAKHGKVILFDAHSIRSRIPLLFDGVLPDLNIGTADGASAHASLIEKLLECARGSSYSVAVNGRFKGGYNTRHYGNPGKGIHAVQLELAQHNYMDEAHPFAYAEGRARKLQAVLRTMLGALTEEV